MTCVSNLYCFEDLERWMSVSVQGNAKGAGVDKDTLCTLIRRREVLEVW